MKQIATLNRCLTKATKAAVMAEVNAAYEAAQIGSPERVNLALLYQYLQTL